MSKTNETVNLSEKLRELKLSQAKRLSEFDSYYVDEWKQELKIKRLSLLDQDKASKWAAKNYPHKKDAVTGVAMVCLSDISGFLNLDKDSIEFLLGEGTDVLNDLVSKVMQKSGLR